jgi:transcription initiation factor TFIIIB Brf1 subunit/transcription initiation factor TFIIB
LVDRKIGIIYKKFQFKLKLNQDTIDYAQRLHGELMEKIPFKYESPYLIAASCILTVSLIEEQQKTFKEFSEVSHIKEADLRQCYQRVFEEIEASLKRI